MNWKLVSNSTIPEDVILIVSDGETAAFAKWMDNDWFFRGPTEFKPIYFAQFILPGGEDDYLKSVIKQREKTDPLFAIESFILDLKFLPLVEWSEEKKQGWAAALNTVEGKIDEIKESKIK